MRLIHGQVASKHSDFPTPRHQLAAGHGYADVPSWGRMDRVHSQRRVSRVAAHVTGVQARAPPVVGLLLNRNLSLRLLVAFRPPWARASRTHPQRIMSVRERDPCPHRILDDIGGAFSMGAIGGGLWHSVKGARNAAKGE